MKAKKKNKTVIVAMSGGVDSSVVAAMLKKEGYDVVGVFMNFWSADAEALADKKDSTYRENKCCSLESIQSARSVAQVIGIPFYVINVQNEFKKKVVDYFIDELQKGNTPNPCVMCNKELKFKVLLEKMLELKADLVATGHYAKIIKHRTWNMEQEFRLFGAKDKSKDQSYFLYKLGQKELSKIIFPLGDYKKTEVRKIAKNFGLSVHDKKESQDICFISEKGYENFLKKHLKIKKGKIVDLKKNILGFHKGLPLYTIGQRKGIEIGGEGPYYVIRKDFEKNELIVGAEKDLFTDKIELKNVNWIGDEPKFPFKTLLRTRYRNPLVYGIINKSRNTGYKILLDEPQKSITSGQSVVFYSKKGEVSGGGIIKN